MSKYTRQYDFTPNTTIESSQVDNEFNAIKTALDDHIDDAIVEHADGSITAAKLDANASKNTIILTPAGAVYPATSGAELVQINGTNHSYFVADFNPNTDEWCFWHFTMPANWDGGDVTVHIKYIANATSGDVLWITYYAGISEGENIDPGFTIEDFATDTVDGTANNLCIASKTFALTGVTAGEWVIFKLKRDANHADDTLAVDARLLEVVLEWTL